MEWISVKDRLPDKNGCYLCCKFGKFIDIVYFVKDFTALRNVEGWNVVEEIIGFYKPSHFGFEDTYLLDTGVTHWMSLPELPKE